MRFDYDDSPEARREMDERELQVLAELGTLVNTWPIGERIMLARLPRITTCDVDKLLARENVDARSLELLQFLYDKWTVEEAEYGDLFPHAGPTEARLDFDDGIHPEGE